MRVASIFLYIFWRYPWNKKIEIWKKLRIKKNNRFLKKNLEIDERKYCKFVAMGSLKNQPNRLAVWPAKPNNIYMKEELYFID